METALLEQTLRRPDAFLFIEKMQAALAHEREQRQHFYETIEENRKMEFINGENYFQAPVKRQHNATTVHVYKLLDNGLQQHSIPKAALKSRIDVHKRENR
ncbi:hypothetical protein GCM10023187_36090 [Nibrella viscosa]|uniref:Uncharacterized protein n=1 Tax=Nibrella viscosa TaxID=1084524 RepID=A0ABP8KN65_9BACT